MKKPIFIICKNPNLKSLLIKKLQNSLSYDQIINTNAKFYPENKVLVLESSTRSKEAQYNITQLRKDKSHLDDIVTHLVQNFHTYTFNALLPYQNENTQNLVFCEEKPQVLNSFLDEFYYTIEIPQDLDITKLFIYQRIIFRYAHANAMIFLSDLDDRNRTSIENYHMKCAKNLENSIKINQSQQTATA